MLGEGAGGWGVGFDDGEVAVGVGFDGGREGGVGWGGGGVGAGCYGGEEVGEEGLVDGGYGERADFVPLV